MIYRKALALRTLPKELASTMKLAITLVNEVKGSALSTPIFKKNYALIWLQAQNTTFPYGSSIISKGVMFGGLQELREES
jgi:hypothetical protein